MKKTEKSACGTSFHNTYLDTTPNALIELFGEPPYNENEGYDKVNLEWVLEDNEGNIITIYDWKEYRVIDMGEIINFHIGGMNQEITNNALKTINKL